MICSHCGFDNPARMRFCGQCAAPLDSRPGGRPAIPPHAERRQLTVMFCDLVNSTGLSEQLDPEELREVIQRYHQTAVTLIHRFDGYVAQYLGDGLLVYFGYPVAHEDDAQRAVLTGLGIVTAMAELNRQLQTVVRLPAALAVRVGVHTGLVVVGEVGLGDRRVQLAIGETTNIAARIQGLAQPDSVLVSKTTYRLVQGYFTCQALGAHLLKGISRPLEVYHALDERRVHTRLDAAISAGAAEGLTPLVGRDSELARLLKCWEAAKQGRGQLVLLSGEAGIGKSRLVQVLRERIAAEPHVWLDCYCSPYHQNTALYPFVELLQRLLHLRPHDSPGRKLSKLEVALQQFGLPLAEMVPLFAAMLSLTPPRHYPPLTESPLRQKQKTLQALSAVLLRFTAEAPVFVVMEDLHWVDPSTLEMTQLLVEQIAQTPALILFTFRPTFIAPWPARPELTRLELTRLSREQTEQMARQVAGSKPLPPDLLQQMVNRTDGVPIFIEELTKMMLEQNLLAGPADQEGALTIPATLQDLLMARLDRLATVKEVAQLGATIGREFSYALLRAIAPLDENRLREDLARLVEAELLHQVGLPPQARYMFKHALIQEAAYRSQLRSKRQTYHRKIAEVLNEQFPEVAQSQPELLAHHYTAARQIPQAVRCWQAAGQAAAAASANIEAARHFEQALRLLAGLAESPERVRQELELKLALGAPLQMTKGYASAEVEANYAQALALCRQLDATPQLLPVLLGLWVFYLARANYDTAQELGREILAIAAQSQRPVDRLGACQVQGINHFYQGQLTQARQYLEQAVALYRPRPRQSESVAYAGADRGVACLSHLALTLWLLGYPDQALARSREALALAERHNHPYSTAFALFLAAWLHQYRREAEQTKAMTMAAGNLSAEQGFTLLQAVSTILGGWALTDLGQFEAGVAQIFAGFKQYHASGGALGQLHFLALLAEAHGRVGQIEEGLAVLEGALIAVQEKGERFYEAELYRLKGELLSQTPGSAAAAEPLFQQAIAVARSQQARSLELRAAVSLARLRQQQGRQAEGRALVQAIYNQFTEGFATADLREAAVFVLEE